MEGIALISMKLAATFIALALLLGSSMLFSTETSAVSVFALSSSSSSPLSEVLQPPPLKVFLLVGQSNMQGHGYMTTKDERGQYRNGTLEWMVQKYPHQYGMLKDKDNNNNNSWTVRSDTWIAYNRENIGNVRMEMNQYGPLVPGFGGDPGQQGDQMGPELGFGWTVGDALNSNQNRNKGSSTRTGGARQQLLLIKVAWGGRNLAVDFRPPSSGGDTGLYYESVVANTFRTLSRLEELFPEYASIGSYELAGFAWHQGWNDGCDANMTAEYEFNLANLIRDLRNDLGAPDLPVSIAVSGFHGYTHNEHRDAIIAAQFAVANSSKYPEFAGTVASVETRSFARPPRPESPGTQIYHWNNNCETYWLVGKAMGEAMVGLLPARPRQVQAQLEES